MLLHEVNAWHHTLRQVHTRNSYVHGTYVKARLDPILSRVLHWDLLIRWGASILVWLSMIQNLLLL